MSALLFYSLWQFYKGLKQIGVEFKVERCILAAHILAFGLPIVSGMIYIFCILRFNQVAMFTSSRATAQYWDCLGPTILYKVTMSVVQILQLVLITNYSIKASARNDQTAESEQAQHNWSQRTSEELDLDNYIEQLLQQYRESKLSESTNFRRETVGSEEIGVRPSIC